MAARQHCCLHLAKPISPFFIFPFDVGSGFFRLLPLSHVLLTFLLTQSAVTTSRRADVSDGGIDGPRFSYCLSKRRNAHQLNFWQGPCLAGAV